MDRQLLSVLVEPRTHYTLTLKNESQYGSSIESGTLESPSGAIYPIVNGIPRFTGQVNYTTSFGLQWNRFAKTQLDSASGYGFSRQRFNAEVDWDRKWMKEKLILDAGCGSGRFSEIAAETDCRLVAVDMSNAIDAARKNLSSFTNVSFVQADVNNLPFRPGTFDAVYSIGVLQHTEDPCKSLRSLLEVLSIGGHFAVTIYGRKPWTKLYSKYLVRKLISGVDNEKLLRAIELSMPIAFPITDTLFRIPLVGKLFKFVIPVANYVDKTGTSRQFRYEEAVLDTFDMLSPKFDNPMTIDEVVEVFNEIKVQDFRIISSHPVNVTGVR